MKRNPSCLIALLSACLFCFSFAHSAEVSVQTVGLHHAMVAEAGQSEATISPEDLVKALKLAKKEQPLVLNVGPRTMYSQAHIPGAEYIAPGSSAQFNAALQTQVKGLPHAKFIVIYCGCCPWGRCPNVHPALDQLHTMGFTNVKMLYIADNFGTDWVYKGYPTAKGE
jgi:thiosulfate/3-mercaptopyruvate sulfurtransferase